jgi:hypothetical protein
VRTSHKLRSSFHMDMSMRSPSCTSDQPPSTPLLQARSRPASLVGPTQIRLGYKVVSESVFMPLGAPIVIIITLFSKKITLQCTPMNKGSYVITSIV